MNPDTNSEIAALRNQIFTMFLALIVVSGTFTTYIYIQSRHSSLDLKQAEQLNDNLKKNEAAIGGFAGQLYNYGQQHPDFQPLLKKYGLTAAPGTPAPGTPAPAAPKK